MTVLVNRAESYDLLKERPPPPCVLRFLAKLDIEMCLIIQHKQTKVVLENFILI